MKVNKRVEITVETKRVVIIRGGAQSIKAWCERCADEVEMVTAWQAASRVGVNLKWIDDQVEADQLHFTEMPGRELFICLNSLLRT